MASVHENRSGAEIPAKADHDQKTCSAFRIPHSAFLMLVVAWLLLSAPGWAAMHCVRAAAGGSGSGADWTNAYPQLPADLVRGDVYYVAAGTYPGYEFDDPEDGTKTITVLKATAADHGTNTGWQGAYGAGVAVWGCIEYSRSYYTFDGITGSGRTGYGFEIFSPQGNEDMVDFYNAAHDVAIRHVHMHFADRALVSGDGVYGDTPAANITVAWCYIHDIPRCPLLMRHWTNLTFEHNWVARNKSTAEIHAEGVSTHGGGNFTFRYNVWQDIEGTAIIVNLEAPTHDWKIYGNVFYQSEDPEVDGLGHGVVSDNFGDSAVNGLVFYNNTIAGIHGGASGLQFWADGSTNIKAMNNIWCRCENVAFNNVQSDYNLFASATPGGAYAELGGKNDVVEIGEPFVDMDRLDFHLKKHTDPGLNLSALFARDLEGKVFGSDGNWDRGALEFNDDSLTHRTTQAQTPAK